MLRVHDLTLASHKGVLFVKAPMAKNFRISQGNTKLWADVGGGGKRKKYMGHNDAKRDRLYWSLQLTARWSYVGHL